MEYDVFFSYNSKDRDTVLELADALEERGLFPWIDTRDLVPGQRCQEALERAIESTRRAAVLFGPAGIGPWEEREMRTLINRSVENKWPVIPVLLPGAPDDLKLPLFLQDFVPVDLREGFSNEGLDDLERAITDGRPKVLDKLPRHSRVPPSRRFIERQSEMAEIRGSLLGSEYKATVVWGMAGCGKTAMACEIERLVRERQLVEHTPRPPWMEKVIWFDARNEPLRIGTLADTILYQYGSESTRRLSEGKKVAAVFHRMKTDPCLLICDNIESIASEDTASFQRFVVEMPCECRLLITTRDRRMVFLDGQLLPGTKVTVIRGMTRDEALKLAESLVAGVGIGRHIATVSLLDLVDACEWHPLTIVLVIGQLCFSSIDDVVEALQDWRASLTRELSQGSLEELCGDARKILSPEKIFQGVWEHRLRPEAQRILTIIALSRGCAPRTTMGDEPGVMSTALQVAIHDLTHMALLNRPYSVGGERYFSVHPLVQIWTLGSIRADEQHRYRAELAGHYAAFLDQAQGDLPNLTDAYKKLEIESWNIIDAMEWCFGQPECQEIGLEILLKFVRFLWNMGRWDSLTALVKKALKTCKMCNDARVRLLYQLAWVSSRRNDFGEAAKLLGKAEERLSDPNSYEAGRIAHSWGQIESRQDHFSAAEKHLQEALDIYGSRVGRDFDLGRADVWDNLGDLYRDHGLVHLEREDDQTAQSCFEQSLKWYRKLLEFAKRIGYLEKEATATGDIGHVQLYLEGPRAAEHMLQKGLELAKKIGRSHTIAYCSLGLGELNAILGDTRREVALKHFKTAKEIYGLLGMKSVVDGIGKWENGGKSFVRY